MKRQNPWDEQSTMTRLRDAIPLLATLDSLIALSLAVSTVVYVNFAHIPPGGLITFLRIRVTLLNVAFAVVFAILWKQCLTLLGLYDRDLDGLRRLVGRTAAGTAIMTALLALYLQARHARGPIAEILAGFLIVAFVYEIGRVILCSRHMSFRIDKPERVLILGSGRLASKAWRELRLRQPHQRHLLGFVDDRDRAAMPPDIASRLLGNIDDLAQYLLDQSVDEVIVALPMRSCYDLSQRAVSIAEAAGVRVVCLHDVFALTKHSLRDRADMFVELVPRRRQPVAAATARRFFDVIGLTATSTLKKGSRSAPITSANGH